MTKNIDNPEDDVLKASDIITQLSVNDLTEYDFKRCLWQPKDQGIDTIRNLALKNFLNNTQLNQARIFLKAVHQGITENIRIDDRFKNIYVNKALKAADDPRIIVGKWTLGSIMKAFPLLLFGLITGIFVLLSPVIDGLNNYLLIQPGSLLGDASLFARIAYIIPTAIAGFFVTEGVYFSTHITKRDRVKTWINRLAPLIILLSLIIFAFEQSNQAKPVDPFTSDSPQTLLHYSVILYGVSMAMVAHYATQFSWLAFKSIFHIGKEDSCDLTHAANNIRNIDSSLTQRKFNVARIEALLDLVNEKCNNYVESQIGIMNSHYARLDSENAAAISAARMKTLDNMSYHEPIYLKKTMADVGNGHIQNGFHNHK